MEICWVHENKNILDKEFDINKLCRKIKKDKAARKTVVVLLAVGLTIVSYKSQDQAVVVSGSMATGLAKVDNVGYMLLKLAQKFGKWAFLVMGLVNVIRDGMEGASKDSIIKTIIRYLIMFASLFALPWMFDLIESF